RWTACREPASTPQSCVSPVRMFSTVPTSIHRHHSIGVRIPRETACGGKLYETLEFVQRVERRKVQVPTIRIGESARSTLVSAMPRSSSPEILTPRNRTFRPSTPTDFGIENESDLPSKRSSSSWIDSSAKLLE